MKRKSVYPIVLVLLMLCFVSGCLLSRRLPPMPEVDLHTDDARAYIQMAHQSLQQVFTVRTNASSQLQIINTAVVSAEKAKALAPNMAEASYFLGYANGIKGMLLGDDALMQQGIQNYNDAVTLKPILAGKGYYPPLQYMIFKIRSAAKDDRLTDTESISLLKEAVRVYPDFAPAHLELAIIYGASGKSELSLQEARTTVELAPDNADAQKLLALCYSHYLESRNEALSKTAANKGIAALKEAIRLNPDDADAHSLLGIYYGFLGMMPLKAFEIKTAVGLDASGENLFVMGNACLSLGDVPKAMDYYRQAGSAADGQDTRKEFIGYCHYLMDNYPEACDCFKAYLEEKPHPEIYRMLWYYHALLGAGQKSEADRVIRKYAETFTGTPWETALLNFALGKISHEELVAAAKQAFDRCEAYYYIGCHHFHNGHKQEAEAFFKKVLETRIYDYYEYSAAKIRLKQMSNGAGRPDNASR